MDTDVDSIQDVNKHLSTLPLTSTGVFGGGLEDKLRQRHEKKLKELLPELGQLTTKATAPSSYKRKHDSYTENYPYKQPRLDKPYSAGRYTQHRAAIGRPTFPAQNFSGDRKPDYKQEGHDGPISLTCAMSQKSSKYWYVKLSLHIHQNKPMTGTAMSMQQT